MSSEKVTRGRWYLPDSTCSSRSSFLLQDKGPGLMSLGVPTPSTCHQSLPPGTLPSLSICLPSHRHSPGPASFPCCYLHWPPRTKDLVPSSTMRRWVADLGDSYPNITMVGRLRPSLNRRLASTLRNQRVTKELELQKIRSRIICQPFLTEEWKGYTCIQARGSVDKGQGEERVGASHWLCGAKGGERGC